MNNSFMYLFKSKPVKQDVSHTVIPTSPIVSVLCSKFAKFITAVKPASKIEHNFITKINSRQNGQKENKSQGAEGTEGR